MAAPETTIWSMDRHTQAKHEILRRYLGAWLPILINGFGRARIIDGFAGPGEYENGEIGSPIIALQTLLDHPDKKVQHAIQQGAVDLIFIEQNQRRSQHLQQLLDAKRRTPSYPARLWPRIITGTFTDEMNKLLASMERPGATSIPTFVFIDPFGYSHTPLNIIKRIMSLPRYEVLINFMAEEINRFLGAEYRTKEKHYDDLFGTVEWRQLTVDTLTATDRTNALHNLYRRQLLNAGSTYVRSFRMRNKHNATDYFLFFCTNNEKGLVEMKRAMWGVDPTGSFEFSDFSNPYQPLLLTEPNYADLQRLLVTKFKGKTVFLKEIHQYVLAETPYLSYKLQALKPLEQSSPSKIRVVNPPQKRKSGQFPDEMMCIEFL